jgi:hypothetical protein
MAIGGFGMSSREDEEMNNDETTRKGTLEDCEYCAKRKQELEQEKDYLIESSDMSRLLQISFKDEKEDGSWRSYTFSAKEILSITEHENQILITIKNSDSGGPWEIFRTNQEVLHKMALELTEHWDHAMAQPFDGNVGGIFG